MNRLDPKSQKRASSSFFASVAIISFGYSSIALLLLHFLRPDYTIATHMISDYAVGPFGWIMTTVFVAMGCGCLALCLGTFRSDLNSITARLGAILMGVASIGLVTSALFPTDLEEATVATQSGAIHDISFLVNIVSVSVALILFTISFWSNVRWRPHLKASVGLLLLMVLGFVLQFMTLHQGSPYGVANRFFVTVLYTCFFAFSKWMYKLGRE